MTSAVSYVPIGGWGWVLRDPVLPERLLAKLWRAKTGAVLRTTDGRRVRVVYPGRPAPGHGPDFRDAVLEIDGTPVNGPVELHRVPSDWLAHGHHHDPAYDNVILHVIAQAPDTHREVFVNDAASATTVDARTAVQELPTVVLSKRGRKPRGGSLLAALSRLSDDALRLRLTEAGLARFDGRVDEARRGIEAHGPDQLAMMRIMDCLGFSENREPFAELSRRAPYAVLRAACRTVDESRRTSVIERLLLSGAGFTPPGNEWQCFVGTQPMPSSAWRVAGVRPPNHPRRRIAALAIYLSLASDFGLGAWLSAVSQGGLSPLLGALAVRANDGSALVGDARAREIAVNAVLPLLAALGDGDARGMYEAAPSLPDNTITREALSLIGKRRGLRLGGCQQQGLLALYRLAVGGGPYV